MPRMKEVQEVAHGASLREDELRELEAIKRLLILLLAKLGADSNEIGMALDISPSTVHNWISFTKVAQIPMPRRDE